MFGLERLSEIVELEPPSKAPSVPDTDSVESVVTEDVATVFNVPLLPAVYVTPLDVKFERVVMFCDVFTLNALPLYVSPVPAVVVAPE